MSSGTKKTDESQLRETLAADPDFQGFAQGHSAILQAYRSRDWRGAKRRIKRLSAQAAHYGMADAHAALAARIDGYVRSDPGPDWDGTFQATEK